MLMHVRYEEQSIDTPANATSDLLLLTGVTTRRSRAMRGGMW
jgi:hypothetical protein